MKAIGTKRHFAYKYDSDGNVTKLKHKTRFEAKCYSQQRGIAYKDTYSPTTRLSTICIILQLVAKSGGIPKQMDIKTAYLSQKRPKSTFFFGRSLSIKYYVGDVNETEIRNELFAILNEETVVSQILLVHRSARVNPNTNYELRRRGGNREVLCGSASKN